MSTRYVYAPAGVIVESRPAVEWVSTLPAGWVTTGERLVLLLLAADSFDGQTSAPGRDAISEWSGLGSRSVFRILDNLCKPTRTRPALLAKAARGGGRGRRTTYLLLEPNLETRADGRGFSDAGETETRADGRGFSTNGFHKPAPTGAGLPAETRAQTRAETRAQTRAQTRAETVALHAQNVPSPFPSLPYPSPAREIDANTSDTPERGANKHRNGEKKDEPPSPAESLARARAELAAAKTRAAGHDAEARERAAAERERRRGRRNTRPAAGPQPVAGAVDALKRLAPAGRLDGQKAATNGQGNAVAGSQRPVAARTAPDAPVPTSEAPKLSERRLGPLGGDLAEYVAASVAAYEAGDPYTRFAASVVAAGSLPTADSGA